MTANVLDGHIHQFSLLICCTLCMRCVSSDENCLPPTAPTEADVSFFSTLGCSLQGALTTGSMALALLSPFIWSERVLAPVLVCRWPSFHLASPIPPPELPWQLAAIAIRRQTTSPWAPHARAACMCMYRVVARHHDASGSLCALFSSYPHFSFSSVSLSRLVPTLSLAVWVFQPLPLVSGVRKELIIHLEGNQLWARVALTSACSPHPTCNHFLCSYYTTWNPLQTSCFLFLCPVCPWTK